MSVTNKDIKIMEKAKSLLKEDYKEFEDLIEKFKMEKKVVSDKQNARNKANKEYHRIVNNISNSRVRGNKKKEIYWTEKLQELKNGGTI